MAFCSQVYSEISGISKNYYFCNDEQFISLLYPAEDLKNRDKRLVIDLKIAKNAYDDMDLHHVLFIQLKYKIADGDQ